MAWRFSKENMRKVRVEKGVSQADLALKMRMDRQYISAIELGIRSPTVKTLVRIANTLKCPPAAFFAEGGRP